MPDPISYLKRLGLTLYNTPPPTPEEQSQQDTQAQQAQQALPPWKRAAITGLNAGVDFLKGATGLGDQGPAGPTATNLGQVVGAAIPLGAPFYSRVERAISSLPEKVHPIKALSTATNLASKEEIGYRGLQDFLTGAGNKPIPKAAIEEHLQAHPLNVAVEEQAPTKYGSYTLPGPKENYREHLLQIPRKEPTAPGLEGAEPYFQAGHFDTPNIVVHARTSDRHLPATGAPPTHPPPFPTTQPSWEDLQNQGWRVESQPGDTLRGDQAPDHWFHTIRNPEGEMQAQRGWTQVPAADYAQEFAVDRAVDDYNEALRQSQQPGAVGAKGRFLEEVQSDWHQAGKTHGYQSPEDLAELNRVALEAGKAREAHDLLVNQLGGGHLNDQDLTFLSQVSEPGDTVEDLVNRIPERANWHPSLFQQGSPPMADLQDAARNWLEYHQAQGRSPVHATWDAANQLAQSENRMREAQEVFDMTHRVTGAKVPDAPFKESWPDLALKHQLVETAKDPTLDWLGFTTGQQQADRYNLSKHLSKIEFRPSGPTDADGLPLSGHLLAYDPQGNKVVSQPIRSQEELVDHIGKDATHRLLTQGAPTTTPPPSWEGYHSAVDPNDEDVLNLYDPEGKHVFSQQQWSMRDWAPEEQERSMDPRSLHNVMLERYAEAIGHQPYTLEGQNLEVGGEGMKYFYDTLLPSRLGKLLKPFGGSVERGAIAAEPKAFPFKFGGPEQRIYDTTGEHIATPLPRRAEVGWTTTRTQNRDAVLDQLRLQLPPAQQDAWIARLTPEMKQAILQNGFPLLALLGLANLPQGQGQEEAR